MEYQLQDSMLTFVCSLNMDSSNCLNIEDIVNLTLNMKRKNFVLHVSCPDQRKLTFQPNIKIFGNANKKTS